MLITDDHAWYRRNLAKLLERECHIFTLEADNALQALTLLESLSHRINAVVSDLRMDGMLGDDLLDHIGKRWPHIPRMLLSAYTTGAMHGRADYEVVDKGIDDRAVAAKICALAKAA